MAQSCCRSRQSSRWWGRGAALLLGGLLALPASAQGPTPLGLWTTVADDGKTVTARVRITESAGVLSARVEQVLDPKAKPGQTCEACTDARRGQPLEGLVILQGVRASSSEAGVWEGGEILDPENGKTYQVRLTPNPNGGDMQVRGYLGISLLGRTQVWKRVE